MDRESNTPKIDGLIALVALALLVFMSLMLGAVEPWSLLVFELGTGILCLVWAGKVLWGGEVLIAFPSLLWPFLGLFLLGIIQSVAWTGAAGDRQSLSMDVDATRSVTLLLFCFLLWVLVMGTALGQTKFLQNLSWFLPVFGVTLAILALVQKFTSPTTVFWVREVRTEAFGSFVNRNHFAGYMEMLLPFPIAFIVSRLVLGEMRYLYGAATAVMGIAVLFTLSRGGAIALLAEILFLVALGQWWASENDGTKRRNWAAPLAGIAIILLILTGVVWIGAEPIILRLATGDSSGKGSLADYSSGRGEIWRNTWQMIKAHPVSGIGLGAFESVYPQYSDDAAISGIVGEAHNDYLQLLADAGIIGGLLGLGFLFFFAKTIHRIKDQRAPLLAGLSLGAAGGIFGLLIHSFFDFNLHLPSHVALFLLLCLILSRASSPAPSPSGY